jgi:hypothetical protein
VDVRFESHARKGSERWKATNSRISIEIEGEEVVEKKVHQRRKPEEKGNATPDQQWMVVRHYGLACPGARRVYFGVFYADSKGKAARRL